MQMADVDNDGLLEFIVTGINQANQPIFIIYDDNYLLHSVFPGFENCQLEIADVDNDNDLDILIAGTQSGMRTTKLYNNNNGTYSEVTAASASFDGIDNTGDMQMANIDNDGAFEFIVAGRNQTNQPIFIIYDDNYTLLDVLTGFENCMFKFADIDNDNDLDILIAGTQSGIRTTKLFTNNLALGVSYFENNSLNIYPNPSSDYIRVSSLLERTEYKISDVFGKKIKQGYLEPNEEINIQNISSGVFILTFENKKAYTLIKK
jgi:hypothetical protein